MRLIDWRISAWLLFAVSIACPPAARARTATEAFAKGHSYAIPPVTYCTGRSALDALIALRHDGDLDSLPPGCFSPGPARFSAAFTAFIPDHKVAGVALPEKLSHPNRFGRSTCADPDTGASVSCVFRIIRSGFVAGTFVGPSGARTPAFIEVAYGIEVIDPRSGDLQFAPLSGPAPMSPR
jgi:hypothetical protein